MNQVVQTPEQQHYLAKLLGYDYTIKYRSGASNTAANALSRIPTPGQCLVLSIPSPECLNDIKNFLSQSSAYHNLRQQIQSYPEAHPEFSLTTDWIRYRGKLWLPPNNPFIPMLLVEFHSTPLGGHMGETKTLRRLQDNFYWDNMRHDVHLHISECSVCQHIKHINRKSVGLLQPLPIPSSLWEELSLDFVTGLPPSHGYTTILVMVDRYSKDTHLGALPPKFTAHKVAALFLDTVCKLHGFPCSLVFGRDPIFLSAFWRELFRLSATKL